MRRKCLIAGVICCVLCVICLVLAVLPQGENPNEVISDLSEYINSDLTAQSDSSNSAEPYQSPIDFEKLKQTDSNVYAWLSVPGTNISYPVAQSPTDDNYYLKHTINGEYSDYGTLFTEHLYNGTSFDDRVTIIYGHHMYTDSMFGSLQELYADGETFESLKTITVYCPNKQLNYEVFAAVPFSNQHILYHYKNFSESGSLTEFINDIYSIRSFNTNFDEDVQIQESDKILILSTCLQGNRNKRYLVLAKLADEIN